MFILNKIYLKTAQATLAWSLPSVSRTCCLWFLVSLPPSMTFHPHPEVMQPFLVSSDTNFFYHPSTYSNSLDSSPACICWQCSISYTVELSQFFLKLFNLLFLFLNYPNILCIKPAILQGGAMSQSADIADANIDEDVDRCLNHFVFHVLSPLLMNNAKSMW